MQESQVFEKRISKTVGCRYLLSQPEGLEPGAPWPLVVFLHGAGERGTDLGKVTKHGPPKRVQQGTRFPFLLVSPQCEPGAWWNNELVIALIDEMLERYPADANRVYLTGLSMGGFGTWSAATEYPERFAAIAPVCGGGAPYVAHRLKDLPTWAFHGAKDEVVPLYESQRMVEALKRNEAREVRFTIYPDAGHDSWTPTYDNPELYDWLLSHRRVNGATG